MFGMAGVPLLAKFGGGRLRSGRATSADKEFTNFLKLKTRKWYGIHFYSNKNVRKILNPILENNYRKLIIYSKDQTNIRLFWNQFTSVQRAYLGVIIIRTVQRINNYRAVDCLWKCTKEKLDFLLNFFISIGWRKEERLCHKHIFHRSIFFFFVN